MSDAKIYGESLHALAKEERISKEILRELKNLNALFKEHPDYVKIFDSPQIPRRELMKILNEDFFGKVNGYLLNFIKLLSEKHMVHCLDECFREFERHYNEDNNIRVVRVTTAKPMSETLAARLVKRMEEKTGGQIILKRKIDQSLVGGIIIKTDDMSIDASVVNELNTMRQKIAN